MTSSLEKRKKFLPCLVHKTQRGDSFSVYVFPNRNVLVKSNNCPPNSISGYTAQRSTSIDLSHPDEPIYKATLKLIPAKDDPQGETTDDTNNNNAYFVSSLTIPR